MGLLHGAFVEVKGEMGGSKIGGEEVIHVVLRDWKRSRSLNI